MVMNRRKFIKSFATMCALPLIAKPVAAVVAKFPLPRYGKVLTASEILARNAAKAKEWSKLVAKFHFETVWVPFTSGTTIGPTYLTQVHGHMQDGIDYVAAEYHDEIDNAEVMPGCLEAMHKRFKYINDPTSVPAVITTK